VKILIACTAYPPDVKGGGEISTGLLASGLADLGAEVVVLAGGRKISDTVEKGVRVIRRPSPNIYWSLESAKQPALRKLAWHGKEAWFPDGKYWGDVLDREKPDIVHTSTIEDISTAFWMEAGKRKLPVVHTLRSYTLLCLGADMFRAGGNCQRACVHCATLSFPKRQRSRLVDGVVGIGNFVLRKHLEMGFFPNALSEVIPNAVVMRDSDARKGGSEEIQLGYLGRLVPEKGLEVVLAALRDADCSGVRLRIAGRGTAEYESRLRRLAEGLPVSFEGWSQPDPFLAELDALVVPSLWNEPFGRVVAEAFSFGCPVIAANRGGLAELVTPGDTGFVYDADSVPELVRVVRGLDQESLREMRSACFQRSKSYDTGRISQSYGKFYERVLSRR